MGGCSGAKVGRGGDEEDGEDDDEEDEGVAAAADRVIGGIEDSGNVVYGKA